jgi:hypothetical protein
MYATHNKVKLQKLKSHICNMQEQSCLHAIKACKVSIEIQLHSFLPLALNGDSGEVYTPAALPSRE